MLNRVELIGKLLDNPDFKELDSGNAVANLTLVTWKYINKSDGSVEKIKTKHKVVCWGDRARKANKELKAGDLIYIDGEIVKNIVEKEDANGEKIFLTFVKVKANLIKRIQKAEEYSPQASTTPKNK